MSSPMISQPFRDVLPERLVPADHALEELDGRLVEPVPSTNH
jgi:hypothetical protein